MDMDITAEAVDDVADILTKLSDLNISDTSVRDFIVDSILITFLLKSYYAGYIMHYIMSNAFIHLLAFYIHIFNEIYVFSLESLITRANLLLLLACM